MSEFPPPASGGSECSAGHRPPSAVDLLGSDTHTLVVEPFLALAVAAHHPIAVVHPARPSLAWCARAADEYVQQMAWHASHKGAMVPAPGAVLLALVGLLAGVQVVADVHRRPLGVLQGPELPVVLHAELQEVLPGGDGSGHRHDDAARRAASIIVVAPRPYRQGGTSRLLVLR